MNYDTHIDYTNEPEGIYAIAALDAILFKGVPPTDVVYRHTTAISANGFYEPYAHLMVHRKGMRSGEWMCISGIFDYQTETLAKVTTMRHGTWGYDEASQRVWRWGRNGKLTERTEAYEVTPFLPDMSEFENHDAA